MREAESVRKQLSVQLQNAENALRQRGSEQSSDRIASLEQQLRASAANEAKLVDEVRQLQERVREEEGLRQDMWVQLEAAGDPTANAGEIQARMNDLEEKYFESMNALRQQEQVRFLALWAFVVFLLTSASHWCGLFCCRLPRN
mgnify:CR=1 FL=1